ncbi:MAG: D-alanyl-D-alanine carboxypeptidase family protein [Pseudomonadota bacterium]
MSRGPVCTNRQRCSLLGRWGFALALSFAFILGSAPGQALPQSRLKAAIVIDTESGHALYQENPDAQIYPASLVKMMTIYLTLEAVRDGRLSMSSKVKITKEAARQPPSRLGLKVGQTINVRDAIYALITKSANDVAVALAQAHSGSVAQFVRRANVRALQLGMTRTNFRNPSGLPDRGQYSTVRDMARLSQRLYHDFPRYYPMFNTTSWRFGKQTYRNHNRLLGKYPGMEGLKTGYINASGFNLATSVKSRGGHIIAVVVGQKSSTARDRYVRALLDRVIKARTQYAGLPAPELRMLIPPLSNRPRTITVSLAPKPPVIAPAPKTTKAVARASTGVLLPPIIPSETLTPSSPSLGDPIHLAVANPTIIGGDLPSDQWSAQFGAYASPEISRKRLDHIMSLLGPLPAAAQPIIYANKGPVPLYRVRVADLTLPQANALCAQVRKFGESCFTVPPIR